MPFLEFGRPSLRLIFSYILDWTVILATAGVGAAINSIEPYKRPFSLLNLDIAFPFAPSTVSVKTLVLAAIVAPGLLIFLLSILLIPGPSATKRLTRGQLWRRKLWEWNVGWMGLGLSLASAYFITQGMKNLFGVARPHMLAVCQPDLGNIDSHIVGGFGQDISARWTLVSASICQTTDTAQLKDSFRSFPSGHSSTSWSGLLYLSLWFCAKFGVRIPTFASRLASPSTSPDPLEDSLPVHRQDADSFPSQRTRPLETASAAPPTHLLVLAFVPIGAAIYVTGSRYADFHHHGFDVIFGSLIGITTSTLSFRYYQMPLSHHSTNGWAWGPRSKTRAFGVGVGTEGYVGEEGWDSNVLGRKRRNTRRDDNPMDRKEDMEMQRHTRSDSAGSGGSAPLVGGNE
ncbi:MAG: hypothetical protein Q9165_005067 [Trypethelium subeluteriae]